MLLFFGLLLCLGLNSCDQGKVSTESSAAMPSVASEVVPPSEATPKVDDDYPKFRDAFSKKSLPHLVGPDMDPDVPAIPMELQMAFLQHGNDATRPYAKFDLAEGFDCLVTVEDPTEGVHYLVLNVFTPKGERTATLEIAGNDGNAYNGFLREDKKISVKEAPSDINGLKQTKERIYEIDAEGKITEVGN